MGTRSRASRARAYRRGLLLGVLGGLLGMLWLAAGPATPAWAHAYLVDSSPADGEVVPAAPAELVLTFSEPVTPVTERFLVVAPDGELVDIGAPQADGAMVTVPLPETTARGTYLASYRIVSADSHPVGGAVTFSIGASSQVPELPTGEVVDDDPALTAAMSALRYAGYLGLVLVVGPVSVLLLLWPQRLSRQGVARLVWAGVGLVAASTLVSLWLQAPYTTGGSPWEVTAADIGQVLGSTYGQAGLVRVGVLAAALFLLRPVVAGRAARTDLVLLGGLGLLALGTWPAAGHPIASPLPAVSAVMMMVHLAAVTFWVGGLVMLVGFLLRLANDRELRAILPVWSGWAATAVVVLLLAGLIQAVIEVASPDALFSTPYGRLLLAKVGLVAVVVAVAAVSRRIVRERAGADRPGLLRLAVAVEAALLAVVLGVSAVLAHTTPARTEAAAQQGAIAITDYTTTVETALYELQVTVEPAERGSNSVHLYAFTLDGEPQPVVEWTATAAMPEEGLEAFEVSMLRISDNHAIGELSVPVSGQWRFRFTLRLSEVDQASVTVDVPID